MLPAMLSMPGAAAGAPLRVPSTEGGGARTAPLDRWGLKGSPAPSLAARRQGKFSNRSAEVPAVTGGNTHREGPPEGESHPTFRLGSHKPCEPQAQSPAPRALKPLTNHSEGEGDNWYKWLNQSAPRNPTTLPPSLQGSRVAGLELQKSFMALLPLQGQGKARPWLVLAQ